MTAGVVETVEGLLPVVAGGPVGPVKLCWFSLISQLHCAGRPLRGAPSDEDKTLNRASWPEPFRVRCASAVNGLIRQ